MISFIRTKICELYSICKKVPSIGRQRNGNIYKEAEQLFALYYSLLTFLRFEQHIFAEFTNCFHISHYSLLTFFLKNNPKNREFTIYLLDPPTYELGTFSAKISHHAKNKFMGVVFKLPRASI